MLWEVGQVNRCLFLNCIIQNFAGDTVLVTRFVMFKFKCHTLCTHTVESFVSLTAQAAKLLTKLRTCKTG